MFFIFLCIFVLAPAVLSEGIQKCETWKNIEEKLKETALQVNCTHTTTCTGISCFLEKYGYEVQSGLHMNACEKPSSVEFEINIPKLNIKQWKRKFYHGATFSLNDNVSGKFEMEKYKDNITLGLTLQIHSNSPSSVLHLLPTILPDIEYPVFHNIVFPMPSCVIKNDSEHTTVSKSFISESISFTTSKPAVTPVFQNLGVKQEYFNCSIRNGSCPEHELCQQTEKSKPEGTCVCMPDYVRDKTGKCIYSPSTVTTTETPGGSTPASHDATSNTSLLLTAILVPLTVILLIVGVVYGTVRFRICQHLRRRLRVQVYEHVLLGQDDDELEDDASNPVA